MNGSLEEKRPWTTPWWKPSNNINNRLAFVYLILIHVLAAVGVIVFPIPGWPVFLGTLFVISCGGLGVTVGFHRALAHRSVKLNPIVEQILILFAVFNGSGTPSTWIANHRNHHANADTVDDVSSPRHGGFWWAHLRWVYQWAPSSMKDWSPDMIRPRYLFWTSIQPLIILVSLTFGYFLFGWIGFFWLGPIRFVYILHLQMAVNSLLHMKPGLPEGIDSSQNIWWLGPLQVTAWGENWHWNHHSRQGSAKFSRHWWQMDIGWYVICTLRLLGLAKQVRT